MTETTYDVGLDANGDIPVFTRHITGPQLTAQRLGIRLGTILKTLFWDQRVGLPYLEWSDGKATTKKLNAMGSLIRATTLKDSNVTEIQDWTQTFTAEDQAIEFRFVAIIDGVAFESVVLVTQSPFTETGNSLPYVAVMMAAGVF